MSFFFFSFCIFRGCHSLLVKGSKIFSFWRAFFKSAGHLGLDGSDRGLLRLDVVAVEVLLEVEVRELVALRDGEELLERRIGGDRVLRLEVLLLHVVVDKLRDLRAGEKRAIGLREELAELVRHLDRALEDGRDTGLRLSTLLNLDAALALAGILDLAVDAAVKALDLAEKRRRRLAERRERRRENLEVLLKRREGRGNDGGASRLLDRRGGDDDRRGSDRGGSLRGLGGLRGLRLNDRGGRRNDGDGLLLSNNLGGLGGGLGGSRAHYTGSRGSLRRHFTRYTDLVSLTCINFYPGVS